MSPLVCSGRSVLVIFLLASIPLPSWPIPFRRFPTQPHHGAVHGPPPAKKPYSTMPSSRSDAGLSGTASPKTLRGHPEATHAEAPHGIDAGAEELICSLQRGRQNELLSGPKLGAGVRKKTGTEVVRGVAVRGVGGGRNSRT
jgi:hypothetical protein